MDLADLGDASMLVQERMKIYDKSLIEKGLQKGLRKGRKEGQKEGRLMATRELAQNMLALGIDINQVMKITGLTQEALH